MALVGWEEMEWGNAAAQRWLRAEAMAGRLLGFGAAALVGWDGFLGCGVV